MNPSPRVHIPSLLQFALSGLALMATLSAALGALALALVSVLSEQDMQSNRVVLLSTAWIGMFISLLLVPGAALAALRLFGAPRPALLRTNPLRAATIALLLWVPVLAAGWLSSTRDVLTWLVLPPLQVLAVAIPLWWFVEVGRSRLPQGSAQRGWGVFTLGMVMGPTLAIIAEIVLIVALIIVFAIWVSTQPALVSELMQLAEGLRGLDPQSPRVMEMLTPYLERPGVVAALAAVTAGLVPLLEELVKPLPVLALAMWRKIPPAEGFAAGLVLGAAFGLIESLGMAANLQGADWAPVLATRVGTGLLHIVTTGLVGWGIASALRERRWLRLLLTFAAAVILHGLWNLMAVLVGVSTLGASVGVPRLALAAAAGLGLLAMVLYTILVRMNRRLRLSAAPSPTQPVHIETRGQ